ncbi:tail protein [Synechococcus phage S-CAM7]|uniref:Uncharacterized protein n=1 Tax=Synechococcus phage S-CAM7 TaxID=1883368 RepID=A0A1D8KTG0_9CAUD|nr:tail protein [Synechococcus phage S-CAM7]AOV61935.1 hypothetical protein C490910_011 [Synechococcus phage S-CAM7]AOV62201.1 hypothetical protein S420910_011 [Synechococcus phage S-CAM7]QLF86066.1 hypothetical protein CC030809_00010 [Synechococcus phage S-CAM7]
MSTKPSLYKILTIKKGDRDADFRLAAVSIDFYEDIMCPTVSCTIQIANSGGVIKSEETGEKVSLYEGMKIRSGEEVQILIAANSPTNEDLDYSTTKPLYVNRISGLIRDDNSEFFKMHLISREAYDNEVTFLEKQYPEGVPASNHVTDILNDSFIFPSENDIEQTTNEFGFWGNQMKPFDALLKIASKSTSGVGLNESAGFFFYQTRRGFSFKSIDTLVSQSVNVPKYVYTQYNVNSVDFKPVGDLESLDYKITSFVINETGNMIADLRKGTFSSSRRIFDPLTFNIQVDDNFTGNDYSRVKTLGEAFSEGQDTSIGGVDLSKFPSQIIMDTRDIGTANAGVSRKDNQDPKLFVSQRKMRYNTLFSQSITIQVPLNTRLHAGDLVECVFPSIGDSEVTQPDRTQISGIYMIKELCHHYDTQASYTSMMLIRDTFGERQK